MTEDGETVEVISEDEMSQHHDFGPDKQPALKVEIGNADRLLKVNIGGTAQEVWTRVSIEKSSGTRVGASDVIDQATGLPRVTILAYESVSGDLILRTYKYNLEGRVDGGPTEILGNSQENLQPKIQDLEKKLLQPIEDQEERETMQAEMAALKDLRSQKVGKMLEKLTPPANKDPGAVGNDLQIIADVTRHYLGKDATADVLQAIGVNVTKKT